MNKISYFSDRLSELMIEHNIKSEVLAEKIGVNGSIVRRWILSDTDIQRSNLIKLAEFFDCSIDFLTGRSDTILDFISHECPPFSDILPSVIKKCGKTSYKIRKETKIKGYHLYKWSKGSDPKLSSLILLADYLNCTIDFLVGREE